MSRDYALLLLTRMVRAFGFGFAAVLAGFHLERRGLPAALIGIAFTVGLVSASLTGVFVAGLAARVGRRRALSLCGLLMALTGLDLALAHQTWLLLLAGVTGMLGLASLDLGPFAPLEQAVLAETAVGPARNRAFARYSLTGALAGAGGGLASAPAGGHTDAAFYLYAVLGIVTAVVPLMLSPAAEVGDRREPVFGQLRPLAGLAALFAVDSFGGGLVANAVIAYWLHARFGATVSFLGPTFFGVALLQAASYEVSGRLADRLGLINTMVFTHLPSNLLLLLVPLSPTLPVAVAILLARYSLSQMDVPARQAYLVSIVPPAQRAGAVASTGAVRGFAQAFGPVLAGVSIQAASFGLPFFLAGSLKALYDVTLFAAFRTRRAEHEQR